MFSSLVLVACKKRVLCASTSGLLDATSRIRDLTDSAKMTGPDQIPLNRMNHPRKLENTRPSLALRERAAMIVIDNRPHYPYKWAAITSVSRLFGISSEILRTWVHRAQIDVSTRPGISSDERAQLKQLECESRDLRRSGCSDLDP